MAHHSRGFTSHTYDIKEVLEVDASRLTIRYTDAAHAAEQTVRLNADPRCPVARQLLEGAAQSITVHGDGQWESAYGLTQTMSRLSSLVARLMELGVRDLAEPSVDLPTLRAAIEYFDPSLKRTLNKLMGRVLRVHHPNGATLARALENTAYMTVEARVDLYDDLESDAIEKAARGVFHQAFCAQRDILSELGYDTTTRAWLRISADEVVSSARSRHPELEGASRPRFNATRIAQIDWALLNPHPSASGLYSPPPSARERVLGGLSSIQTALYPPCPVLTAAAIVHCLSELSGLNLSVILRTEPADLIYTGDDNGLLRLAKARNHSEDTLAVQTNSNTTLGGMIEALAGMTRFSRRWRAIHLSSGPDVPEIVNRLYVEHRYRPEAAEVITNRRLHHGWRQPIFDEHWPEGAPRRSSVGLRFGALRRKALERALKENPRADVHGHSERTRIHYLANVLPGYVMAEQVAAAQNDIVDQALARFDGDRAADDDRHRRIGEAIASGDAADVVFAVCVNAGQDPDEPSTPCSLGLAACFTCPNGYRTVDHIPGLLAMVRYTSMIRDQNPDEWENGDAGALHFYASESLKQFPPLIVEGIRSSRNLAGELATIDVLYTELRR